MFVTNDNLTTAVALSEGNPALDIKRLLDTPTTSGLWQATVLLLTRGGPKGLTQEEDQAMLEEVQAQSAVLYLTLAPIWIANNRQLPDMSGEDVSRSIAQLGEAANRGELQDPCSYFGRLKNWNPSWYRVVAMAIGDLKSDMSRMFCGGIVKSVIDKLPDPIKPSPVDIGGDMLEGL